MSPPAHVNTLPIHAPRFTAIPFPPYRFVPGKHPHPIAHPQGHSYRPPGHVEPPVTFVPPERWRESGDYLFGCDLYNHAFWWEAHEAWEGLWRIVPEGSAQKRFLQGLIQTAAIHLQLFQGHADGVARLRQTSRDHFVAAARLASIDESGDKPFMGLRIFETRQRVDAYCLRVLAEVKTPPWHLPELFPYLLPE